MSNTYTVQQTQRCFVPYAYKAYIYTNQICIYICTLNTYIQANTYTCIHTHTHTYVYMYTHTFAYMYERHTYYKHAHTREFSCSGPDDGHIV